MLAEAKREAERIVKEARERQTRLISEEEVTKQAERAAEDIIEDARGREREIRLGAEDYADEILNTLEVNLSKFIAAVQRGRERLQGKDEPAEVAEAASPRPHRVATAARCPAPPPRRRTPLRAPCGTFASWPRSRSSTPTSRRWRSTRSPTRRTRSCCTAAAWRARSRGRAGRRCRRRAAGAAPIELGEAVATTGGRHAGALGHPRRDDVEPGGTTNADVIRRVHRAPTLWKAEELGARSLALVAFGTGVGGFPLEEAAAIEAEEVQRHLASGSGLERVVFAVRGRRRGAPSAAALADGVQLSVQPRDGAVQPRAAGGRCRGRDVRPPARHRRRPEGAAGRLARRRRRRPGPRALAEGGATGSADLEARRAPRARPRPPPRRAPARRAGPRARRRAAARRPAGAPSAWSSTVPSRRFAPIPRRRARPPGRRSPAGRSTPWTRPRTTARRAIAAGPVPAHG